MNSENFAFKCSLRNFDGPLDVLWMLIRQKKMDIHNLDVVELANQYALFIQNAINDVSVDEFSEYTLMSAYLIELKARSLLPDQGNLNLNARNFNAERESLIQRLLEYKMYKDTIPVLQEYMTTREYMFEKAPEDYDDFFPDEIPLGKLPDHISVQKLKRMFEEAMRRGVERSLIFKKVEVPEISITQVQIDLIRTIEHHQNHLKLYKYFDQLPPQSRTIEYFCMLFLAMLILIKRQWITVADADTLEHIDFDLTLTQKHDLNQLEDFNKEDIG